MTDAHVFALLLVDKYTLKLPDKAIAERLQVLFTSTAAVNKIVIQELFKEYEHRPQVKAMCHALQDMGYTAAFTADLLKIALPNVYYHLRTELKKPFYSRVLEDLRYFHFPHGKQSVDRFCPIAWTW
jgi:hypothetical protein